MKNGLVMNMKFYFLNSKFFYGHVYPNVLTLVSPLRKVKQPGLTGAGSTKELLTSIPLFPPLGIVIPKVCCPPSALIVADKNVS